MKTIAAGKFKANCLAIMDEVKARHETIVSQWRSWCLSLAMWTTFLASFRARDPFRATCSRPRFPRRSGVVFGDSCGHARGRVAGPAARANFKEGPHGH